MAVVSNVLLLSQTTGYLVNLMLSMCVVVPTSLHMGCFKGHCLFFTRGTFLDDGNFSAVWASRGYCIYVLSVGSFLLIVSAVQSTRMLLFLYKGSDSSFLSAFLESLLTLIMTVCAFIASILVTIGFKTWCEAVTQRFRSCDEASVMEIDTADKIKIEGFYVQIGTAQFGVWGCWVCSVLLVVLSVLKLCRYHERESMRVSMARQRRDIMRHQYEQPVESADDA